jgi:hypothetical protein
LVDPLLAFWGVFIHPTLDLCHCLFCYDCCPVRGYRIDAFNPRYVGTAINRNVSVVLELNTKAFEPTSVSALSCLFFLFLSYSHFQTSFSIKLSPLKQILVTMHEGALTSVRYFDWNSKLLSCNSSQLQESSSSQFNRHLWEQGSRVVSCRVMSISLIKSGITSNHATRQCFSYASMTLCQWL